MTTIFRTVSKPPANLNPVTYNENIKYFLDSEVSATIANLTAAELDQFFEMVEKYHLLFAKIYLMEGDALVNYIVYGNEFYEALKKPHAGIDYTPSLIVQKYKEWAAKKGLPVPADRVAIEKIDTTPMTEFQSKL